MATETVTTGYRTLRVGFCIEEGNIDQLLEAVRLNTILWGGIYNPIIAVGKNSNFANRLTKLFLPDLLYGISGIKEIQDFIKENNYLISPFPLRQGIFKPEGRGIVPNILDVSNIIDYYWDTEFKTQKKSNCIYPTWNDKDIFSALFTIEFGQYPSDPQILIKYADWFKKGMRAKVVLIPLTRILPKNLAGRVSPIDITGDRLTLVSRGFYSGLNESGLYIGYEDNFFDLLNYWNLRAAGIHVKFLPISNLKRHKKHIKDWVKMIEKIPKIKKSSIMHTLYYRSEVDQNLVKKAAEQVLDQSASRVFYSIDNDATWNGLNIKPPEPDFETQTVLADVDWRYDTPSVTFQLPEKPTKRNSYNSSQHLVLRVNVTDDYSYKGYTLDLPFIPELNKWHSREVVFLPDDLRVNRGGFGVIKPLHTETERLRPIRKTDLIKKLFERADIKAIDSQSGLITQRIIEQMGGDVDDCRVFKITGVRKLIEGLKPEDCVTYSTARDRIRDIDELTELASFEKHKNLHIQQLERPNLTPEEVFDFLVEKNVFRIGFQPECPNCKLKYWISLTDVKEALSCEFCGHLFKVATQFRSRGDSSYRRSGLFGKDNHQEGSLPVILSLMQLQLRDGRKGFGNFLYSTALKLTSKKLGIECETDLVFIDTEMDKTLNILIGECKTKDKITEKDIDNLVKVKKAMDSKSMKTYLLFAKTHSFTPEEIGFFKKLSGTGISPILFSAQDLEPYDMHEFYTSNKKILPRLYPVSLEDMVINSRAIYLV